MDSLLNQRSGWLGISGVSSDFARWKPPSGQSPHKAITVYRCRCRSLRRYGRNRRLVFRRFGRAPAHVRQDMPQFEFLGIVLDTGQFRWAAGAASPWACSSLGDTTDERLSRPRHYHLAQRQEFNCHVDWRKAFFRFANARFGGMIWTTARKETDMHRFAPSVILTLGLLIGAAAGNPWRSCAACSGCRWETATSI